MKKIGVIGGITTDIEGRPDNQLVFADSNPGKIRMSYGGVGRNIVENLARMGVPVGFVSVAGDDFPGRSAVRELFDLGVDVDHVSLLPGENTAVYMSILNLVGEMELAMCNMDILERISIDVIKDAEKSLRQCSCIGIDTNLTEASLDQITELFPDIPLFLDPVSTAKAVRARDLIGKFHTIKPNRMEAEVLTETSIISMDDLKRAGSILVERGVKNVFITLGPGGVYYQNESESGVIRLETGFASSQKKGSVTGAGDAFSAALLYSILAGYHIEESAHYGMAASRIAMESNNAVNPSMSRAMLLQRLESGMQK